MNKSEAADAARTMEVFFDSEHDPDAHDKYAATFDQAREHLPEGALTALVQRPGDNAPMLVSLKAPSLYLLTILDEELDAIGQPRTNCTMLHVAPGAAIVESEPRFRTRGSHAPAPRSTTWRFKFTGGTTLLIEAHFHPGQRGDGREELAQALAGSLGWELPVSESMPLAALG